MSQIFRAAAVSALLTLAPLTQAEDASQGREYWVSIASFEEFEQAENARQQASERLTERLSIAPATIPAGYVLRVVAGPYFDRTMAEQVLETSRLAGFESAWIFTQEVPATTTMAVTEGVETTDTYESSESTAEWKSDFVPASASASASASEGPARKQPTFVDQAPANYSVHRLHRD